MSARTTRKPKPAAAPPAPAADVLTPAEAAAYLRVGEDVVIREAEAGALPGRNLGGEWRFSRSGLLAWLDRPVPAAAWPPHAPFGPWTSDADREAEAEIAKLHSARSKPKKLAGARSRP